MHLARVHGLPEKVVYLNQTWSRKTFICKQGWCEKCRIKKDFLSFRSLCTPRIMIDRTQRPSNKVFLHLHGHDCYTPVEEEVFQSGSNNILSAICTTYTSQNRPTMVWLISIATYKMTQNYMEFKAGISPNKNMEVDIAWRKIVECRFFLAY